MSQSASAPRLVDPTPARPLVPPRRKLSTWEWILQVLLQTFTL